MSTEQDRIIGWWKAGATEPQAGDAALRDALGRVDLPFSLVEPEIDGQRKLAVAEGGEAVVSPGSPAAGALPLRAVVPVSPPENLGDPVFRADHGLRYAYVAGAMANGVGSEAIVEEMGRAGMVGFFGAAGLPLGRIEAAIDRIQASLGSGEGAMPYGFNLIHSPHEPAMEENVVDLYLKRGVKLVSAAAYLRLTPALIRYRVTGLHRDAQGRVVAPNRVIGKISRVEVARRFFAPPPEKILKKLVEAGKITAEEAELAAEIPVGQDITAEADSGGHTDNQPFVALLPTMIALRDQMQDKHGYAHPLRVGAAGGIGTPASAAAAFSMGAAYILTGSINQACEESGTSATVREMLRQTKQADVAMAPAADMFEMGVKVQVLKRGSMFPMRATKLYEIYRAHESLESIPAEQMAQLERDYFQAPVDEIWRGTEAFFAERDPKQIERARQEPHHKMALLFRWYLGMSSGWSIAGDPGRKVDFQIWCGPAMGAFNEWVKGSPLDLAENRRVVTVAHNLMIGAAISMRISALGAQGVDLPRAVARIEPLTADQLKERLN